MRIRWQAGIARSPSSGGSLLSNNALMRGLSEMDSGISGLECKEHAPQVEDVKGGRGGIETMMKGILDVVTKLSSFLNSMGTHTCVEVSPKFRTI